MLVKKISVIRLSEYDTNKFTLHFQSPLVMIKRRTEPYADWW